MKNILIALIAIAGFSAAVPSAQAGGYGKSHGKSYGHSAPKAAHCKPAYVAPKLICTEIVRKKTECRTGYDHCGRKFTYHVTVITYKDVYSNGHNRFYAKTLRA